MKTLEIKPMPGDNISETCSQAAILAALKGKPVSFKFNDTVVVAQPGESSSVLQNRWHKDYEAATKAYRESPKYKAQQKKDAEDLKKKQSAKMKESASTEAEMRVAKVPWPHTPKQLAEYIESLVSRSHDYGTCVYAMSMAAEAAFNYVSGQLGVTGFQASCADLDFIRRTRLMTGPFILLKAQDALYPQHNLPQKLHEAMEDWKPWLKEEAVKNLKDRSFAHPNVVAHWKKLAGDPK